LATQTPIAKKSPATSKSADARVRYSGDFPTPAAGEVPYALSRPELADLGEAQATKLDPRL